MKELPKSKSDGRIVSKAGPADKIFSLPFSA